MMQIRNGKNTNAAIYILLIVLIIYLIPVWVKSDESPLSSFSKTNNDFTVVFFRSLIFAILNSLVCIVFGLWLAFKIIQIDLFSFWGKTISMLIIPFLLGSTSVAFVFKILLLNSELMGWTYKNPSNIFVVLTIIQFWQFGTLFIYLFWLSLKSINVNLNQYAVATKMTRWEYFKDICMPNLKGLIILLSLICFIYSFYEDVKISLIFKVSEGLNAELISHWIFRNYQSNILIGYNFALQKIARVSQDTLFGLGVSILLIGIIRYYLPGLFRKIISKNVLNFKARIWINLKRKWNLTSSLLPIMIILPLVLIFSVNKISFERIDYLLLPLALSFIAAFLATTVAIAFSFFTRLVSFDKMGSFNLFSLSFLSWLYVILFIPPLEIMLGGFEWMKLLNLHGFFYMVIFWLFGHSILSLPLLGSFLMVTNFRITSNELNYCKIYNISQRDIFRFNFFEKFKAEYLLAFLFAYTIILNEGLLNKVFSDKIPSFVSALNDSISSKNADYSLSMLFFMVSIIVAFTSVGIWIHSMKNYRNEKSNT